jgi:hypothetical protein
MKLKKNLRHVLLVKVSLLLFGCSSEPTIEDLFRLAKKSNHEICFSVKEPANLVGNYCIYGQK